MYTLKVGSRIAVMSTTSVLVDGGVRLGGGNRAKQVDYV